MSRTKVELEALASLDINKRDAFLEAFSKIGVISKAAQAAGCDRHSHYFWLETDEDYAERFNQALELFKESVDFEIFRRAVVGIDEPVIYQGQRSKDANGNPVTVKRLSDTLLIVKAKQLGVFVERQEHTGFGGGPIEHAVQFYLPANGRDQAALEDGNTVDAETEENGR